MERFNLPRKVEQADLVVCISDFTRSQLMYLTEPEHWAKLRVVHCGADLSRYRLAPPRKGPGFVVLCVARLAPAKGLEVLLSAMKVIIDRGAEARLVLVGDGPLRERLRRAPRTSDSRPGLARRSGRSGRHRRLLRRGRRVLPAELCRRGPCGPHGSDGDRPRRRGHPDSGSA